MPGHRNERPRLPPFGMTFRRARPAYLVGALTVAFLLITAWWLSADRRVPDFDNGRHLFYAFNVHDALSSGDLLYPLTHFTGYPPLVHVIGALGTFVGGVREAPAIIAQDLVFVPLLAAGCYGVGRCAYGSNAGLLAVVFALGTPMLISQFHVLMLDAPETAMTAVSAWALVSSERFARIGVSALAGLLCGLGMLTKPTFCFFVGGLITILLVRGGGWRHWRGLLAFASVLALIAVPWYLEHVHDLGGLVRGATAGAKATAATAVPGGVTPPRWSRKNFGWYFWDLVNHQLLVPLSVLVLVGAVMLFVHYVRRRDPADLTPELLVGGLVSYLGPTYLTLKDPRYTLPSLVYLAVLGSGWIELLRPRAKLAASCVVGALAVVNTLAVSFGLGHAIRITLPGAPRNSGLEERHLTLYSPAGWVRGGPEHDGDVLGLMHALHRLGFRVVDFDPVSANVLDFNVEGLRALARIADLHQPGAYAPAKLRSRDAFLLRHFPAAGDPPPCQRLHDGSGVYVELGNPLKPFYRYRFICPGRRPAVYQRSGPPPYVILGVARRNLLRLMHALRRHGVRVVEFDPGSTNVPDFNAVGLTLLAQSTGLRRPAVYAPSQLGPHDAFLLRHVRQAGDPAPCVLVREGGIYVVLGNPVIPFDQYRFYCPLRHPVFTHRAG
jgi:4-amino-4-deoxy-L-arabinose transferase-like glycosyltransferase